MEQQELVNRFVETGELPEKLDGPFVQGVSEVLAGLTRIDVTSEKLRHALLDGGAPATPGDLKKRFEAFLDARAKGKDPQKVRIIWE